jgi:putative ABC transport system permease protein
MLGSLRKDLVYAFRMIIKTPVVTVIAIVSLALGVAANTMIFAVVNQWLLRPFPYHESESLVMLWEDNRNIQGDQETVSVANYLDWRDLAASFQTMIASELDVANLTGLDRPERVNITRVNRCSAALSVRTRAVWKTRPSWCSVRCCGETSSGPIPRRWAAQ